VTSEFLRAGVDTLLPGDDGDPPLPNGTAAGVTAKLAEQLATGRDREPHRAVLEAIAAAARSEDAFVRADAEERTAAVQRVESALKGSFEALVSLVLQDYYETEAALLAMGWRREPPQPQGHVLPPFDETLLEPVKRRGRLWR
jgi:hypothetical protein